MAKSKTAVAAAKTKSNKKGRASRPKPHPKTVRRKKKTYTAAVRVDYAIWGITFYHYDSTFAYYYPIYDDEIDKTMDLYIMGEASPSNFADHHIKAKIETLAGGLVHGENDAPHFSPYYPSSWIATIPANTLAYNTAYVVKVRHHQDKAAASSEFSTLPANSQTPPPSNPNA